MTRPFFTTRHSVAEGSQIYLIIGDLGLMVVRGGNPFNPGYSKAARVAVLHHISFGVSPWNADAVRAALDQRGIAASVDTGGRGDIHQARFQSYHLRTPNSFDLQISNVNSEQAMYAINVPPPK